MNFHASLHKSFGALPGAPPVWVNSCSTVTDCHSGCITASAGKSSPTVESHRSAPSCMHRAARVARLHYNPRCHKSSKFTFSDAPCLWTPAHPRTKNYHLDSCDSDPGTPCLSLIIPLTFHSSRRVTAAMLHALCGCREDEQPTIFCHWRNSTFRFIFGIRKLPIFGKSISENFDNFCSAVESNPDF